jgi:hypothetical protein
MAGLIEEIQRDASDDSKSVAQLLRRVKIAASKLKLGAVEAWVDHELGGYPANTQLPDYRVLGGVPMSHHVHHGWRMMRASPDETMNRLFGVNLFTASISEVERNVTTSGHTFLSYPEWLERMTLPQLPGVDKLGLHVDQGKFRALLSGVRNRCLEWTLEIERAGITGEGLSFSDEERRVAKSVIYNLYGDNSRVNQNSTDNSTNQVFQGDVFERITRRVQEEVKDPAKSDILIASVGDMKKQSKGPDFAKAYANFVGVAADHIGVLQFALPLLAAFFHPST